MCMNKHTVARLQDGPQCGIVALVMSGSEKFQVQEVQDLAINKGFTNKGEMFSVENMADLANSALNKEVSIEPISKIADSRYVINPRLYRLYILHYLSSRKLSKITSLLNGL